MPNAAVIKDGIVSNVIVVDVRVDPAFLASLDARLCLPEVAKGWRVSGNGLAPPPVPEPLPEPSVVPTVISDRQFAQVLATDGDITQDEALAWAARGDLPKKINDALAQIPEEGGQRFGARMLLAAATSYERHHPLVPTLGALLGKDAAALDSIWTRGAAL